MKKLICILISMLYVCACSKDTEQNSWSIALDSNHPVIESKVEDIAIKFCLLNSDSIPANAFKEGENFYFYSTFKNLIQEIISIEGSSIGDDFLTVYQEQPETRMGKPWSGIFCEYKISPKAFIIPVNDSLVTCIPWSVFPDDFKGSYYPFCIADTNAPLSKGVYSCRFKINLKYKITGVQKRIDGLCFEINFKIEEP